jgi:hypothetical protein
MDGQEIVAWAQALARHSDSTQHYTRTYLTPAHQAAARRDRAVDARCRHGGAHDAVGNVIGRYEGASPGARALCSSARISTRCATAASMTACSESCSGIACVADLARRGERLAVAIEVVAFADEEGTRFQTGMLSSRCLVSGFDPGLLDRRDLQGVTLADAMRAAGLDPARAAEARIDPSKVAGYVEVHIEQGPVLLNEGRALGVVTAIAAGARHLMTVTGEKDTRARCRWRCATTHSPRLPKWCSRWNAGVRPGDPSWAPSESSK